MPNPLPRREALLKVRFRAENGSWPIEGTAFRLETEFDGRNLKIYLFEGANQVPLGPMLLSLTIRSSRWGKKVAGSGNWVEITDQIAYEELFFSEI